LSGVMDLRDVAQDLVARARRGATTAPRCV
jgi:hypothetical protein